MRYVNDRPPPDTLPPGPRAVMSLDWKLCPEHRLLHPRGQQCAFCAPLPPPRLHQPTLDEHCRQEAEREVDSWLTGKPYRRRPWRPR